jgi:hypothetical protein
MIRMRHAILFAACLSAASVSVPIDAQKPQPVDPADSRQDGPRILISSPRTIQSVQRILVLNEQIRADMQSIRNRCAITQAEYDEWFRVFQHLDDFREITEENVERWAAINDEAARLSGEMGSRAAERDRRGIRVCR